MPPEALFHDSLYDAAIDCFSLGVLSLQVLTGEYPDPTDPYETVNENLMRPVPEVQRRQDHIRMVNQSHLVLAIALTALKDQSTERPPASELSIQFERLKRSSEYTTSMERSLSPPEDSVALRAELASRDARLDELSSLLRNKDDEIRELKSASILKDATIRDLESRLVAKEALVREKDSQLEESGVRAQEVMMTREKQHKEELDRLKETIKEQRVNLEASERERRKRLTG